MKFFIPLCIFIQIFTFAFGGQSDSITALVENYINENEPPLPQVNHLFIKNISCISLCKGPHNTYYLTGTIGEKSSPSKGIQVWASHNLTDWNTVGGDNNFVWTVDNIENPKKGILSPEIHFFNETFWLTYTDFHLNKSGILKSISGLAQGPYEKILNENEMVSGANASLFFDSDSTVYFIWNGGNMHTMKPDMSGFQTKYPVLLGDTSGKKIGENNIHVTKIDDHYYIAAGQYRYRQVASDVGERFDGIIALSKSLKGPYTVQHETIPHGGAGVIFQDFGKKLWYCFTESDVSCPVSSTPGFLPLNKSNKKLLIQHNLSHNDSNSQNVVYVSKDGNNSNGSSWDNAYTSIQQAIDESPNNTQIWISLGYYNEQIIIKLRKGLYLYGGFKGNEIYLYQRNIEKNRVIINGENSIQQIFSISSSSYIRVDGLTIANGDATNGTTYKYYGAGMYIIGGGATVTIVNCRFENNIAEQDGGALYASIGASPILINCTFKGNISKYRGGAAALYSNSTNGYHFRFYNCTFENNFSYNEGGAIFYDSNRKGHGLLSLINCMFIQNESLLDCGTISVDRSSNLVVLNSTFCYNKGASKASAIGNLAKVPGKSRFINSIFYKNDGNALFNIEGEGKLTSKNNTQQNNKMWISFTNCLFYSNNKGEKAIPLIQRNYDTKKWLTTNDLNSSIMGTNCTSVNPMFVDEKKRDFRLKKNSPARGKATSKYYFRYNINGYSRSRKLINPGCY